MPAHAYTLLSFHTWPVKEDLYLRSAEEDAKSNCQIGSTTTSPVLPGPLTVWAMPIVFLASNYLPGHRRTNTALNRVFGQIWLCMKRFLVLLDISIGASCELCVSTDGYVCLLRELV